MSNKKISKVPTRKVLRWSFFSLLFVVMFPSIILRAIWFDSAYLEYTKNLSRISSFENQAYTHDFMAFLSGLDGKVVRYYGHARQSADTIKYALEIEGDHEKVARTLNQLYSVAWWVASNSYGGDKRQRGETLQNSLASKMSELVTLAERKTNELTFDEKKIRSNVAFVYLKQDFDGRAGLSIDFVLNRIGSFFRNNEGTLKSSAWLVPTIEQLKKDWFFFQLSGSYDFKERLVGFGNGLRDLPALPGEATPIEVPSFLPKLSGSLLMWAAIPQLVVFLFYLLAHNAFFMEGELSDYYKREWGEFYNVNYANPVVWVAIAAMWPGVAVSLVYYFLKFIWQTKNRLAVARTNAANNRSAEVVLKNSQTSLEQLNKMIE